MKGLSKAIALRISIDTWVAILAYTELGDTETRAIIAERIAFERRLLRVITKRGAV